MTSYCSNCIHYKVCGNEGVDDSAMTYCADKQEERPTAEWIWVIGEVYKCSACGNLNYIMGGKWNYCSNCGSRMKESEEEEE